jgi:hypothetical protein
MRKRPPVDLLRPHAAEEMKAWKVGKAVGNVGTLDPNCAWNGMVRSRFFEVSSARIRDIMAHPGSKIEFDEFRRENGAVPTFQI